MNCDRKCPVFVASINEVAIDGVAARQDATHRYGVDKVIDAELRGNM